MEEERASLEFGGTSRFTSVRVSVDEHLDSLRAPRTPRHAEQRRCAKRPKHRKLFLPQYTGCATIFLMEIAGCQSNVYRERREKAASMRDGLATF